MRIFVRCPWSVAGLVVNGQAKTHQLILLKSPFTKGGLLQSLHQFPPFIKGGGRGDFVLFAARCTLIHVSPAPRLAMRSALCA
jgi:hypothetical protein